MSVLRQVLVILENLFLVVARDKEVSASHADEGVGEFLFGFAHRLCFPIYQYQRKLKGKLSACFCF